MIVVTVQLEEVEGPHASQRKTVAEAFASSRCTSQASVAAMHMHYMVTIKGPIW